MERIPLDTVAYKVVEDIRDYSQLGGLKKEQDRLQQQIYMFNAFMANKQAVLMSLMRLQCMGINEDQIHGMNRSNAIALGVFSTILQNGFFQGIGVNTIKSANMHYHIYKYCSFNKIV